METLKATDRNLDYQAIEETLVDQIKDYVTKEAHSEACIVWVSWWIDSAVVSTLAAKTWLKTVLLTMPIDQAIDQVTRGDKHIAELQNKYPNIIHHNIDLTDTYHSLKAKLKETWLSDDDLYMALVNTRSRLRMVTLYWMAPGNNWIVIWTWNKVEDYGIKFFTKYGDGWVDYSPIGELVKSEVYKLWAHMDVIQEILEARPTDWLHPDGATDEDQLGATYDELEWAMEQHDDLISEIATNWVMYNDPIVTKDFLASFTGRKHEVMDIYLTRYFQGEHKMKMPPVATLPGL